MLDELHVDIAGEERELDRAQLLKGPAFSAAARSDRFVPHGRHFFAERFIFDFHQAWEKFRDFFDAVIGSLGCCHAGDINPSP